MKSMSFVNVDDDPSHALLFKDFVDAFGRRADRAGTDGTLRHMADVFKFYDYMQPLFHHIHHDEKACARYGGIKPKHEHYYFPRQYNPHLGRCPSHIWV